MAYFDDETARNKKAALINLKESDEQLLKAQYLL